MARPPKVTADIYLKAVTLKHKGYSGERVARAIGGIISANYINTLYKEAKEKHDLSECLTNNNELVIVTLCVTKNQ
jgi:hypothetical protein